MPRTLIFRKPAPHSPITTSAPKGVLTSTAAARRAVVFGLRRTIAGDLDVNVPTRPRHRRE